MLYHAVVLCLLTASVHRVSVGVCAHGIGHKRPYIYFWLALLSLLRTHVKENLVF